MIPWIESETGAVVEEFQVVSVVYRPVTVAFAALCDFARASEWTPGLLEARRGGSAPLGVGSKIVFVGHFLGRSYESPAICTDDAANRKLTTRSENGPFVFEVAAELEEGDENTTVTSTYRGESRGFFKLTEPLVVRLAKRQFELAAKNLRELLGAEVL